MSVEALRSKFNSVPYGSRFVHVIKDCENPDKEYYAELVDTLCKMHCGKLFANIVLTHIKEIDEQESPIEPIKVATKKKVKLAEKLRNVLSIGTSED